MAWGQKSQGIDDLLQRLAANDSKLTSLTLMRQRKLNGAQDVARLCAVLTSNPHLTELSITAHALDKECAQHLAGLLASPLCKLTSISLGDSTFGDDAMEALCEGLRKNTSLTYMDTEHKGLGSSSGSALSVALSTCTSLTTLMLGKNALGDAGVINLCHHQWASLTHLDLQDINLGAKGLEALATCAGLTRLHTLSCAYNPSLGPDAAPHLQRLLVAAPQLRRLQLQHTALGDAGGSAAGQGLAAAADGGPRSLADLDLGHTGMTDAGGVALTAGLTSPSCPLTSLSLEGNLGITDVTVTAIFDAITLRFGNTTSTHNDSSPAPIPLAQLNLSATAVTPALFLPLSKLPGLQHLALLGCNLGPAGVQALLATLEAQGAAIAADGAETGTFAFGSLKELVLSACGLDAASIEMLFVAFERGVLPTLVSVELGGNSGCQGEEIFDRVEEVRGKRPGLGVHWRAADAQ